MFIYCKGVPHSLSIAKIEIKYCPVYSSLINAINILSHDEAGIWGQIKGETLVAGEIFTFNGLL